MRQNSLKLTSKCKTIFRLPGFAALAGLLFLAQAGRAQPTLQAQMAQIATATRGPVGAAVVIVEGGKIVSLNGERHFPMQSVYKLPIAMAVLHQVDLGKLKLDQPIRITKADLPLPIHDSPIRDDYPNGGTLTVSKLLDYVMTVSDGTACDILLKLIGRPKAVTMYLRGLGVRNIVVATSEQTMWADERVEQYRHSSGARVS